MGLQSRIVFIFVVIVFDLGQVRGLQAFEAHVKTCNSIVARLLNGGSKPRLIEVDLSDYTSLLPRANLKPSASPNLSSLRRFVYHRSSFLMGLHRKLQKASISSVSDLWSELEENTLYSLTIDSKQMRLLKRNGLFGFDLLSKHIVLSNFSTLAFAGALAFRRNSEGQVEPYLFYDSGSYRPRLPRAILLARLFVQIFDLPRVYFVPRFGDKYFSVDSSGRIDAHARPGD